ncbi:MAG: PAS domain-containing protein [Alphaproteobacteria bacterium]|nr:PAS domain-containing protein [Alphaproteobacteria bacterium]
MIKPSATPFTFSIRDADFTASHMDDDTATARFVMDEKGSVIYATPSMLKLFHIDATSDLAQTLKLKDSPRKKLHNLAAGVYTLADKTGTIKASFRLDWIRREGGEKVLIASHTDEKDGEISSDTIEMDGFVHTLERRLLQRTHHPAALWSREDMAHFIGISSDMMLTMDTGGLILKANAILQDITGMADQEKSEADSFPLLFCDADRPLIRRTLQALSLQETDGGLLDTLDFEAQLLSEQGGTLWSEWKLRREDGKIYAIGRDISAAKTHEQNLIKRQQQLLEAENIGHMGHWRWVIGEESMEWSDQIYQMFGRGRGTFTPTIDFLNQIIHRRDIGRVVQAFQRAMIEQNTYDMDFRINRPDGETRYILCEGRCELDSQGEVVALFGIMQDMTERMIYEKKPARGEGLG